MYTIILASHKNLAKGMKETAEYILGKLPFLKIMTAYTTDDYDILADTNRLLQETEKVIVVTDVLGGSVNTHWLNFVYEQNLSQKVTILSGMTLSLVMELCSYQKDPNLLEQLPEILDSARASIMNCSNILKERD